MRLLSLALLLGLWAWRPADAAPDDGLAWNITSSLGRGIFLARPRVQRSKCGRRIPKGNYRLSATLERDHFRGNTATRGWATSAPSPALNWSLSLELDIQRADQAKSVLRWTVEARNGSWATWDRLFRSEVPLAKLLEEDTNEVCLIMFPKVLPSSRTYRKDPCDHLLCLDVHHAGSDNYPPETALYTTPMEAVIGATLGGLFVVWIMSGWVSHGIAHRAFKLLYLVPLAGLGFVVHQRMQGIQVVRQGKVVLYHLHWGYGEGLSYGTDADQAYHYELTAEFQMHSVSLRSSKVTDMAATRNPEKVLWPEILSWPVPADPTSAHTAATLRFKVFADGRQLESDFVLPIDAATPPESDVVCARASESEASQPQFCMRYVLVAPQAGPAVPWYEQLPGFGLLGYGALGLLAVVVLRKRKPREEGEDAKKDEESEDEQEATVRRKKGKRE